MKILTYMYQVRKPVTIREISRAIKVLTGTIMVTIRGFRKDDLVFRTQKSQRLQRYYFELTQRGEDIARLLVELKRLMEEK